MSPTQAHPCPPTMRDPLGTWGHEAGLAISAAVGPSGTAVVAAGAGDSLGEEKGGVGGLRRGGEAPPKWQREGGN